MYLPENLSRYTKDNHTAIEAQRVAYEISHGPIVFQISRLAIKFGILQLLLDSKDGLTMENIAQKTNLSIYAVKVIVESSLTIGTVLYQNNKFICSKIGWFLLKDNCVRANIDFNHYVNYLGMYNLEEALINGKPEGLKVFGSWKTIYEGLSSLPEEAQKAWFGFDHFYSDGSFDDALEIVFKKRQKTLLDIGGNTGRWALRCVEYNPDIEVTIMDLPEQINMMKKNITGKRGAERIKGHSCNILDTKELPPKGFDAIWLSQFLDCFSENEIISILSRVASTMSNDTTLYIMETFWDRQKYETASYSIAQTSPYFAALANGNSKMYHSEDMIDCVKKAGLQVEHIYDGLGFGHSILECRIFKNQS